MEAANRGTLAARTGTPKSSQSAQEVVGSGNALAQLVVEGWLVLPVGHCFLVARFVHHLVLKLLALDSLPASTQNFINNLSFTAPYFQLTTKTAVFSTLYH